MIFNKECKNHEKIRRASRVSVRDITPDGQMAGQADAKATLPALCASSDGHLSLYQVSFNFLLYFQRYAPDKFFIAKIKGSNSANTGDIIMGFCILQFLSWPSISVSSFIYLSSILLEICSGQSYYCKN